MPAALIGGPFLREARRRARTVDAAVAGTATEWSTEAGAVEAARWMMADHDRRMRQRPTAYDDNGDEARWQERPV
jgi:hypothetical protein